MQRIAIIFDNRPRQETTGTYCRRALGELVQAGQLTEVEHFLPDAIDQIPQNRFDLFLFVDDGLITEIPDHLRPCAWWAIDTHLGFERCLHIARQADFTFAAQQPGCQRLRSEGIELSSWLPLACDPRMHGRRDVANQFDIAFVGHVFPGPRQELLQRLQQEFPRMFAGQRYFEEMAATYSASHCVFNRSIADDVNMRVFEGLCSGSLLVTNALPGTSQEDLFPDGECLVTYTDAEELVDKVRFYLRYPVGRERIAAAGRQRVLERHTYLHRMQSLLMQARSWSETIRRPKPQTSNGSTSKSTTYYEHTRPEVRQMIPASAQRILDVGCGCGGLGASLKAERDCEVVGIEACEGPAQIARDRIDEVIVGNVEEADVGFAAESFDAIVCADVLEHLREPGAVLNRINSWLRPDGSLIASIPNVRHHTVVQSLLAGNFTYESAGLLDSDHVRFFTRREIEKLLFRAGFEIEELQVVPGPGHAEWVAQGRPQQINVGGLQVRAASPEEAEEFFVYQYLLRARPAPVANHGLTSIVLVTHNQLPYTLGCLDSIRLRTDEPYELIVVDNGSTDGTLEYLRSQPDITLIENGENRGFPAAANQGLQVARGQNRLLLNNDTLVTTGWLKRLLEALHAAPDVGLVGSVSNNVSGYQQVDIGYGDLSELDGYAWQHHGRLNGQGPPPFDVERLIGFSLLLKREVSDNIGLLDERFGIGCYEDDDYCRRAREAGYKCRVVPGSFVHHFGSATFRGSGQDLGAILHQNEEQYRRKWEDEPQYQVIARIDAHGNHLPLPGDPPPPVLPPDSPSCDRARPDYALQSGPDGGLTLVPNTIRLSACLIVKDNESTIRPCLESLKPWVDEIVVVDTGSSDATPRICEELGARVFYWAWRDDFAAARNESLRHALGEWILWIDSDDTLPAQCGAGFRKLVDGPHADNILGHILQVHCPGDDVHDVTVVDHVKLIRNRPDLRFEFRIHEQILPAIRRAGGDVAWTDLYVVHSGAERSEAGRQRKIKRDLRLLYKELDERGDHPFVLFNLGMTFADAAIHEKGVEYLQRCLQVSGPDESHLRKAYALLVSSLYQLSRYDAADTVAAQGLKLFPTDKELLFRQAMLDHQQGRLRQAAARYQRVLSESCQRHFASVDARIAGTKARHNLALVHEDLQEWPQALELWQRITSDEPDYVSAWRRLGDLLLLLGDWAAAEQLALHLQQQQPQLRDIGLILAARCAEQRNDVGAAREILETSLQETPDNIEVHNALCRLLFERGTPEDAREALWRLVELTPDDASGWHNLGAVFLRLGDNEHAVAALEQALRLRPDSERIRQDLHLAMARWNSTGCHQQLM